MAGVTTFKIDTDAVIKFTNTLEKMHRSALPVAVRGTLNDAAFDVKKNTIQTEFKRSFTNRNKTFSKRFTRVEMAKGFDLMAMKAIAGFTERGGNAKSRQAVENMTPRQRGGQIPSRTFIPLRTARVGKTTAGNVRARFRLSSLDTELARVEDTRRTRGTSESQRFVRTAHRAKRRRGTGALIRHRNRRGRQIIYQVVNTGGFKLDTRDNVRLLPIYSFRRGRTLRVRNPVPFTFRAGVRSAKKIPNFYDTRFRQQLERLKR